MLFALVLACASGQASPDNKDLQPAAIPEAGPGQAVAVFAGGCFWCMESDFDKLEGVVATTSGFAGGHVPNPSYDQVVTETTGHLESVHVVYDTSKLSYEQVLDWYWHHVDPTDGGGQFCDRGESYSPAIFYQDDAQKAAAEASKAAIEAQKILPGPVAVAVRPLDTFYAAENYHQDFHETNPARYEPYRLGCGRDARVKKVWGL